MGANTPGDADQVEGTLDLQYIGSIFNNTQPISWGLGDYYYTTTGQTAAMYADNDAFRKAGLLGVTLLAASGDSGVGVRREIFQCTKFSPSWPASSPYITSVGATYANSMED